MHWGGKIVQYIYFYCAVVIQSLCILVVWKWSIHFLYSVFMQASVCNLYRFHTNGTYVSCWHWRPSWKGPPHFPHHLQATVHLPGCCICLPIIALRACTWYNRAHSTCEEKQVQKTYNDALLRAGSHNWAVLETLLFRLVLAFLLWWMAFDSSSYIWVVDPWFNESDGESQSQNPCHFINPNFIEQLHHSFLNIFTLQK